MAESWDLKHHFTSKQSHTDDTTQMQAVSPQYSLSSEKPLLGKDIQSIYWHSSHTSLYRAKYRKDRIRAYENYSKHGEGKNMEDSAVHQIRSEMQLVQDTACFYKFYHNYRSAPCSLSHFQLRHLVEATSKHDVYQMDDYTIYHHNSLCKNSQGQYGMRNKVIDLKNHEKLGKVLITTMTAYKSIVIAGGLKGELACKNVASQEHYYCDLVTKSPNAITNFIHLVPMYPHLCQDQIESQLLAIVSSNDNHVRLFDIPSFKLIRAIEMPWPVNHCTISPNGKMLCIVGDDDNVQLYNVESGKCIGELKGHVDYGFASAWQPTSNYTVATGAQDHTTRVWDVRKLQSVCVLGASIGAVRSLKYSSDGTILAAAESADFVHLYDTSKNYEREQMLDVFGEISGVSFAPDQSALFVGIFDRTYKSLIEFERVNHGIHTSDVLL